LVILKNGFRVTSGVKTGLTKLHLEGEEKAGSWILHPVSFPSPSSPPKRGDKIDQNQRNLNEKWVKDDPPENEGVVIKLDVGETITGLLLDKYPSTKYKGHMIYKLKVKDDDVVKVIIGTTILDQWMKNKEINEEVRIKRLNDIPTDKAKDMQNYETYHIEREGGT